MVVEDSSKDVGMLHIGHRGDISAIAKPDFPSFPNVCTNLNSRPSSVIHGKPSRICTSDTATGPPSDAVFTT